MNSQTSVPRVTSVLCVRCGYNLTGVALGGACPECGTDALTSFSTAGHAITSGKAIASMVLGIVAIPSCMLYGIVSLICGGLALYFAKAARDQIACGQAGGMSSGFAKTGMICGSIALVLGAVYLMTLGGFMVYLMNQ